MGAAGVPGAWLGPPSWPGPLPGALPRAGAPSWPGRVPHAGVLVRGDADPPVTLPRGPARDAARHELSKRMYHKDEPSLLMRALNHLWDWVTDLFGTAAGVTPGGGVGLVVIVLAVLTLLAVLWWRLGTPRRTPVPAAPLFDDGPRSAAEHRAAAEAHAAQGHWSQAVQERMRAVVRALEERALLDPRPGRTADEAAAEAALSLPAHEDRLRAAARIFDDVTYGGRSGDQDAYHHLATLDSDLEDARPVLPELAAAGAPASGSPRFTPPSSGGTSGPSDSAGGTTS